MSIIKASEIEKTEGSNPGIASALLVGAEKGSETLRIGELTIAPSTRLAKHIHTNTEEAMMVVEGSLDVTVSGQRATIGPGDVVLAPAGAEHGFVNRFDAPARLLFIFPIHDPDRVLSRVENPLVGFGSEKGLTGYSSPSDRPLESKD